MHQSLRGFEQREERMTVSDRPRRPSASVGPPLVIFVNWFLFLTLKDMMFYYCITIWSRIIKIVMEEHQKPVLRPTYLVAKEAARSSEQRAETSMDEEVELDRDLDAVNRFVYSEMDRR